MTPSFAAVFERAGTNAREQTRYRGHLSGVGNPFYKSQLPPPGPTQAWPGMALPRRNPSRQLPALVFKVFLVVLLIFDTGFFIEFKLANG